MEFQTASATFEEQVKKSELPVLVDFYATWCGPCKMMAPILGRIAEELEGSIHVAKLDIDENDDIATAYRVMSIPTMILFKDGEPVMTHIGATSQDDLTAKIKAALQ